jgi:zinc protease
MLLKGTPTRNAEQLVTEIESVGGSIDSYGGNNSFGVSLEVLSSDLDKGLDLLGDVLLRPRFLSLLWNASAKFNWPGIRRNRSLLPKLAERCAARFSVIAHMGWTCKVPEKRGFLRVEELRACYRELVVPNNGVLAIYGDIQTLEIKSAAERLFRELASGSEARA